MSKSKNNELDYLEISPPSSVELKENIDTVLKQSDQWHAALESLDQNTGTYRIILEGKLKED